MFCREARIVTDAVRLTFVTITSNLGLQLREVCLQLLLLCLHLLWTAVDEVIEEEPHLVWKEVKTPDSSAVWGPRFHGPLCQSHLALFGCSSCRVSVCVPAADAGCIWAGVWVNVQWLALTASPSHKHTCRCCLMECDMDNSLHRSHQYPQLQHWRLPDAHTHWHGLT